MVQKDKDRCTLVAVATATVYKQANNGATAPVTQQCYLLEYVFASATVVGILYEWSVTLLKTAEQ